MVEYNVFGPSPTPIKQYAYHSSTGGPAYYDSITPGFFGAGIEGVLPNAHDMFVDKIKPMLMQPQAKSVNGIGAASDAAVYGAVTGGVLLVGAISFLWCKYVGSAAVEVVSGKKLDPKQKNALGIVGLLLI
tara:strand:+ start:36 stop:428 length:393 start_codon:yes stop_codon:yes gene_type:complete